MWWSGGVALHGVRKGCVLRPTRAGRGSSVRCVVLQPREICCVFPQEEVCWCGSHFRGRVCQCHYTMAGSLRIRILEGRKLIPMDVGGTSDPFVSLSWNGKEKKETEVRFHTLKPLWEGADDNNQFVFLTDKASNKLVMEVYDYDSLGSNDFIGVAVLRFGEGSKLPWCDTVWVDLQGRPGEPEDQANIEKYGGLGQIRISYSFTWFPMSKYFAAEELLKQLGKPVRETVVKVKPQAKPDEIRRDLERLSFHAWRLTHPVIYARDIVRGYRDLPAGEAPAGDAAVASPRGAQVELLVEEWKVRWALYAFVTCMTLLDYVPLSIFHRAARAVVPITLLWLLVVCTHHTRLSIESEGKKAPSKNPFLYTQSPVFFEALFGVERRWVGFDAPSPKPRARHLDSGGGAKPMRATDAEIEESIVKASGRIRTLAVQVEGVQESLSWQRQDLSMDLLTKALLVFLAVLLVPRPPNAVMCWLAFSYMFFVHRLYYTNHALWEKVSVTCLLEKLTAKVRGLIDPYTSLGKSREVEPVVESPAIPASPPPVPPAARGLALAAVCEPPTFTPGDKVDVEYEEEAPGGGWTRKVDTGLVHAVDGENITIDWGCGGEDDLYCCNTRFVTHARQDSAVPTVPSVPVSPREPVAPLCTGDMVSVQYEQEAADGAWQMVTGRGRVTAIRGDDIEVDWGDGDPRYTTQRKFVTKIAENGAARAPVANGTANGHGPAGQAAELKEGDRVVVEYEVEEEEGQWRLTKSSAVFKEHLPGDLVRVQWLGTGEDYKCPHKHVKHAEHLPLCFAPGDIVTVDIAQDTAAQPRTRTDAVVKAITADQHVEVEWLDTHDTYVANPSHLTFLSKAAARNIETSPIAPVADLVPVYDASA